MQRKIPKIVILLILLINAKAKSVIVLPYMEDFDDKVVGSYFEDWSEPFGEIFGPESSPFGESIPFNGNYLFVSGTQGQSASALFPEITDNINFGLDFYSLPNPDYNPPGAFRGVAGFFISGDSEYSRDPRIGVQIEGEIWQNPDDLNVYFLAEYLDGSSVISVLIGTIEHGKIYNVNIELVEDVVNVNINGLSTDITYEYLLDHNFSANGIVIWEGSAPESEYGVGIDNIIIPEPATLLLLVLGWTFIRKKTQ